MLSQYFYSTLKNTPLRLVFVRHGQTTWNIIKRYQGWQDTTLTKKGESEAHLAGKKLKKYNFKFDICYSSMLKRTIKTWQVISDVINQNYIPHIKNWRLNEKHYGDLEGLSKEEREKKYDKKQVQIWRFSFNEAPPKLKLNDFRRPIFDEKYKNINPNILPLSESLKDTLNRVLPYWNDVILKNVLLGKNVIVCLHGDILRSIRKHLDNISDNDIAKFRIPNAIPLVYEFDRNLNVIRHYYLASDEEVMQKIHETEEGLNTLM